MRLYLPVLARSCFSHQTWRLRSLWEHSLRFCSKLSFKPLDLPKSKLKCSIKNHLIYFKGGEKSENKALKLVPPLKPLLKNFYCAPRALLSLALLGRCCRPVEARGTAAPRRSLLPPGDSAWYCSLAVLAAAARRSKAVLQRRNGNGTVAAPGLPTLCALFTLRALFTLFLPRFHFLHFCTVFYTF